MGVFGDAFEVRHHGGDLYKLSATGMVKRPAASADGPWHFPPKPLDAVNSRSYDDGSPMPGMARLTRALTNHAPIGEYRRRFFPDKPSH